MVKIEINDKKYSYPESLDEITFEQYCKVFFKLPKLEDDDADEVTVFRHEREVESTVVSRLLGEADDFCLTLPLGIYAALNESPKFLFDVDKCLKNAKASIKVDGIKYYIPSMEEMSFRQYIDADVVMQDEEDELQYIRLLSVLLTRKDDEGKWIPYRGESEGMFDKLRKLPCSEALGLVYHFFKKSHALEVLSQAYSQQKVATRP